jgi:hypothetical protein
METINSLPDLEFTEGQYLKVDSSPPAGDNHDQEPVVAEVSPNDNPEVSDRETFQDSHDLLRNEGAILTQMQGHLKGDQASVQPDLAGDTASLSDYDSDTQSPDPNQPPSQKFSARTSTLKTSDQGIRNSVKMRWNKEELYGGFHIPCWFLIARYYNKEGYI